MKEQLPGFVLAELFSKSLVIAEDSTQHKLIQKHTQRSENWFLGNYEKKIIVLTNDTENSYADDPGLQFLNGILAACKLDLAHIALINLNRHSVTYSQLKKEMRPQFLLLFGVSATQIELPFVMPEYKVQDYDHCSILIAPALQTLNRDSEEVKKEKSKLWHSLKKMFNLE